MLTPYLGQLLLLRTQLAKHTVVQLEEADVKLLEELTESTDPGLANGGQAAGTATGAEVSAPVSAKAAEAAASVKTSTLRSRVRLATVDNFQGEPVKWQCSLSDRTCYSAPL